MADVTRTAWAPAFDQVVVDFASAQADAELEFGYEDTTFASVGTEYRLSDTVTLRGGVAYDQTPTSYAHRDVRVPDVTRKWLSFGIGWTPSEKVEYNFGYTHLFTNEPAINIVSPTGSSLQGKYEVGGDILAASINYKCWARLHCDTRQSPRTAGAFLLGIGRREMRPAGPGRGRAAEGGRRTAWQGCQAAGRCVAGRRAGQ